MWNAEDPLLNMPSTAPPPLSANRRHSYNPSAMAAHLGRDSSPSGVARDDSRGSASERVPSSGVVRPGRASVRRPNQSSSNLSSHRLSRTEDELSREESRLEEASILSNYKKELRNMELANEELEKKILVIEQSRKELYNANEKLDGETVKLRRRVEELEENGKDFTKHVHEMGRMFEAQQRELQIREETAEAVAKSYKETNRNMRMEIENHRRATSRAGSRTGRSESRSSSIDARTNPMAFAPPVPKHRRDSSASVVRGRGMDIVYEKDAIIDNLQARVGELEIKAMELENLKDGDRQELERKLLEMQMENAKLTEDISTLTQENESLQLLLGQRTANGEFSRSKIMNNASKDAEVTPGEVTPEVNEAGKPPALEKVSQELEARASSKGKELEQGLVDTKDGDKEKKTPPKKKKVSPEMLKVMNEVRSLRDQNKALTLYIEKIISRVLQHEHMAAMFEQQPNALDSRPRIDPTKWNGNPMGVDRVWLNRMKRKEDENDRIRAELASKNAAQPPLPPPKDEPQGLLQRAGTVFARKRAQPDAITGDRRPSSMALASTSLPNPPHSPSAHEDPSTAPSVPLARSGSVAKASSDHRRTHSETNQGGEFSALVNQMYRPSGTISPTSTTPRTAYFAPGTRAASASQAPTSNPQPSNLSSTSTPNPERPQSSSSGPGALRAGSHQRSTSIASAGTGGDVNSPPRNSSGSTQYTGAVMTQNRLRPLRLVQDKAAEEEAARKRANRGSWMGWFNRDS